MTPGVRAVGLVDGDVDQPVQELRAAVLRDPTAQELRPLVDEGGAHVARDEGVVVEQGLEEGDVRRDAADAELRQRAPGTRDGRGEVATAAGQLRQHRVEVRADLRPLMHRASVEADAGAAG